MYMQPYVRCMGVCTQQQSSVHPPEPVRRCCQSYAWSTKEPPMHSLFSALSHHCTVAAIWQCSWFAGINCHRGLECWPTPHCHILNGFVESIKLYPGNRCMRDLNWRVTVWTRVLNVNTTKKRWCWGTVSQLGAVKSWWRWWRKNAQKLLKSINIAIISGRKVNAGFISFLSKSHRYGAYYEISADKWQSIDRSVRELVAERRREKKHHLPCTKSKEIPKNDKHIYQITE